MKKHGRRNGENSSGGKKNKGRRDARNAGRGGITRLESAAPSACSRGASLLSISPTSGRDLYGVPGSEFPIAPSYPHYPQGGVTGVPRS